MKDLLPIGSVVVKKEDSARLMICGFGQLDAEKNKLYDYAVTPWPLGMVHTKVLRGCNHSDLARVISVGYQDEFGTSYRRDCAGIIEKCRAENKGKEQ